MTTTKASARFPNTVVALRLYDATEPEREELYRKARSTSGVNKWSRRAARDLRAVQLAFWNDTANLNSKEKCFRVPLSDLREFAEKDKHSG